jgi:type IV pilus assembly protein PilE
LARNCEGLIVKKYSQGFTLIELMITVAIVGILAAVALPAYDQHVVKTRRSLAKGCLVELGQFMERQYTTSMSYASVTLPNTSCVQDLSVTYSFAFATAQPTATTYLINATPTGPQARDLQCGTLSLSQTGARTVSGTKTSKECWQ